jgi:hypothetical protein
LGLYSATAQNKYGKIQTSAALNADDPFDSSRQQSVARETPNIWINEDDDDLMDFTGKILCLKVKELIIGLLVL